MEAKWKRGQSPVSEHRNKSDLGTFLKGHFEGDSCLEWDAL